MKQADPGQIWKMTFRFSTEVLKEATPGLQGLELEAKEFFVLDGIQERPYPAELASYLSMPRPTMTVYLKSLNSKGFINRVIDPNDLRRHRLELTTSGQATVLEARSLLSRRYGERLTLLSHAERNEFARLLEKLTS
jgi:DNA-binding MarR family transcriptional regulator